MNKIDFQKQSFASVDTSKSVKLMDFSDTVDIGGHSQIELFLSRCVNDFSGG